MRLRRISCWVARKVHLEKFLGWRLFTMICIYHLSENILFYSTTFKLSFFLIWFCLCYLLSCLKSCAVVLLKKGCRNPSPCLAQPQCQIAYNCQWGGCYACIFVCKCACMQNTDMKNLPFSLLLFVNIEIFSVNLQIFLHSLNFC